MNSELEKAYLDTTYSVFVDGEKYDIKIGQPTPSVINHLLENENEKSAVILTAWNPRSKALSSEENKERNNELFLELENNNYIIYKALGKGADASWPAEESFLIVGLNKSVAEKISIEYGQYAYVWCQIEKPASMVFTHLWRS